VRPQEHQFLVLTLHQAAERVEEEARIVHGLLAALVLGHVQLDAEHLAQIGPPSVVRLRVDQGPEAHGAVIGEPRACSVSGHQVVEHEVVHPHDAVHGPGRGATWFAGRLAAQRCMVQQAQRNAV
jgi:hypothetical protein